MCGWSPRTARRSTSPGRCPGRSRWKGRSINGRSFDLRAEGVNLILHYGDKPGALGKIGTLLGSAGANIEAAHQLSQDASGEGATVMLRLDRDVPADVRAEIRDAVDAGTLEVVDLS